MSDHVAASPARPGDAPGALRILALAAVGVGLAALAGAAFVLSYAGIHAFALQAGVSPRLARGYPLLFDVLLVVIIAAVLTLRGAGLPSKLLAWTCLLALLAAAAGADALHAAGRRLPHQNSAVTAAVVPWLLVLVALALLLTMLRHARLRRLSATYQGTEARWEPQPLPPVSSWSLVPGFDQAAQAIPVERAPVGPAVTEPALAGPAPVGPAVAEPGPAEPPLAEPALIEPVLDEGALAEPPPAELDEPDAIDLDVTDVAAGEADANGATASGATADDDGAADDPEMPVFHRMWSAPTGGPSGDSS